MKDDWNKRKRESESATRVQSSICNDTLTLRQVRQASSGCVSSTLVQTLYVFQQPSNNLKRTRRSGICVVLLCEIQWTDVTQFTAYDNEGMSTIQTSTGFPKKIEGHVIFASLRNSSNLLSASAIRGRSTGSSRIMVSSNLLRGSSVTGSS